MEKKEFKDYFEELADHINGLSAYEALGDYPDLIYQYERGFNKAKKLILEKLSQDGFLIAKNRETFHGKKRKLERHLKVLERQIVKVEQEYEKLKNKKPITIEERFLSFVDKTPGQGPNGDCWGWLGGTRRGGYGSFNYLGEQSAHRVSYKMFKHPVLNSEIHICHACDNPPCTNPEHLWAGDSVSNHEGQVSKGRQLHDKCLGEKSPHAKLTEKEVREIRKTYIPGVTSQRDFARKYGVSRQLIQAILSGRKWEWLPDEES